MKNPPAYRPYRLAVWLVYVAVTVAICIPVAIAVARGAWARVGARPEPAPAASIDHAALAGCMQELEELNRQLNAQLDATMARRPARRSSVEWEDWSPAWRERLLAVGARCRLVEADVPGAKPLALVYQGLSEVHRHYTTLAVQYSKEIGPHSDRLQQSIEAARKSLGP